MSATPVDAAGGTGQIDISVNRECTWDARSEAEWIALGAPTTGQGEASVAYTVSANPAVSVRRGAVVINDRRVEIAQAAATCRFTLSAPGAAAPPEGGRLAPTVNAQASCAWTAVSQVDWLQIESGRQGSGQGVVSISVSPNAGPAREGNVLIAGQVYSVSQAAALPSGPPAGPTPPAPLPAPPTPGPPTPTPPNPGPSCALTVSPGSDSFAPAGGEGTVQVTASASNCEWSAASNASWLSLAAGSGTGTGTVRYVVTSNPGAARSGTLTVAGAMVTVSQAAAPASPTPPPPAPPTPTPPACELSASPTAQSVGANGGENTVRVTASSSNCGWTAVSNVSWITVGAATGTGNGNLQYVVAANTGAARSGTITVARTTVTINQAAAPTSGLITVRGEIRAVSGQCPTLTFTLGGRLVRTTAQTVFEERCDRLRNGRDVVVRGMPQSDGSLLAVRVEEDD